MLSSWLLLSFIAFLALILILLPLKNKSHSAGKKRFLIVFVPVFMVISLLIYHFTGASSLVQDKKTMDDLMAQLVVLIESPKTSRTDLLQHLKKIERIVQNNAAGLVRMAELYQEGGFYPEAIVLYEKLRVMFPKSNEYAINWIYCHSLEGKGILPQTVRQQADVLLPTLANKMMLLNLLAIDDYFHGRFDQAVQAWNHILTFDTSLTPERKMVLQNAIDQTKQTDSHKPTVGFKVTVKLGTHISTAKLNDENIYIYVRRPSEKRPIVVLKRNLKELPLTVILDDSHAMLGESLLPGMSVEVAAHLSKKGQAQLQSGDIRGMIGPILVKSGVEAVTLELNEVVS